MSTEDDVRREVEEMHEFFVQWFAGAVEDDDEIYERGLTRRLDAEFTLIQPAGDLLTRDELLGGLRGAYGNNADFRICIRNVRVRHTPGEVVLATYEEWQRNAKASTPSDNGRVATATFRVDADAPNGLIWLHVHETWLPEAVMAAGPYDF